MDLTKLMTQEEAKEYDAIIDEMNDLTLWNMHKTEDMKKELQTTKKPGEWVNDGEVVIALYKDKDYLESLKQYGDLWCRKIELEQKAIEKYGELVLTQPQKMITEKPPISWINGQYRIGEEIIDDREIDTSNPKWVNGHYEIGDEVIDDRDMEER